MRQTFCLLIFLTTSLPHSGFPQTIPMYHLLSAEKLDNFAHFYKLDNESYSLQTSSRLNTDKEEIDIEEKQCLFGWFIGLRGCEASSDERISLMLQSMEQGWQEALTKARNGYLRKKKE